MAKRKTVSIKDIAKESRVSLTTVSLVMNRRDSRISEATRQRVLEAADRLGYLPSRLAQGLQSRRAGMLAILVPQLRHAFADVYFGELISAVHDRATRAGYRILLEVARPEFVSDGQHRELFDRDFVDGMLCLGTTNEDLYLSDFEDGERPVVLVNNYIDGLRLNSVRCDYRKAGRIAAEYLLEQGHRRIALIHGAGNVQTSVDFSRGVREALADAGQALLPEREADGMYTEEGGAIAAVDLVRRDGDPTAIVAGNDKMAIGAISGLKAMGRSVPRDVSVIGCDDIHSGAFIDPKLTTIHTPLYEIGMRACECLIDLIDGAAETVREVQPVSLTVRESVAGPPDSVTDA